MHAIYDMNMHKACGPDNLSSHVLKKCATVLAPIREALILAVYLLNGSKVTWCMFITRVINLRSVIIDPYLYYV